jgi:hypothetical protein
MYLQEIRWKRANVINLAQDRDTWPAVSHVSDNSGSKKRMEFLEQPKNYFSQEELCPVELGILKSQCVCICARVGIRELC